MPAMKKTGGTTQGMISVLAINAGRGRDERYIKQPTPAFYLVTPDQRDGVTGTKTGSSYDDARG